MQYALAPAVTVTPKDKPYLGDFTFFVELNGETNVQGSSNGTTTVTFLPGVRSMLLSGLWLAAGYEIPVTSTHQLSGRLWLSLYLDF